MNNEILKTIHSSQAKKHPEVQVGDSVKLNMRITEGSKTRVQAFEGIVIAMKGTGSDKTMTVRKISSGIGVERIIPFNAPTLEKVTVVKRGKVRRSKLYYMRDRVGKKAMKINASEFVDENEKETFETKDLKKEQVSAEAEAEVKVEEAEKMTEEKVAETVKVDETKVDEKAKKEEKPVEKEAEVKEEAKVDDAKDKKAVEEKPEAKAE